MRARGWEWAAAAALWIGAASAHEIHKKQEKEFGDGLRLEFEVAYLDPWGHTVADATGLHYHHDRISALWNISPEIITSEPKILPDRYWGTYPLFYAGRTMNYRIRLTNLGHKKLKRARVVAIQEYLRPDGTVGERIGSDATRDWPVPELDSGQSAYLEGSIAIPTAGIESGLDQTHIQVFRAKTPPGLEIARDRSHGRGGPVSEVNDDPEGAASDSRFLRDHHHDAEPWEKRARLLFEDIQAGIWCPPAYQPSLR